MNLYINEMKTQNNWRIPLHKKKLVALRMYYRGGYTVYFFRLARKMLAEGYPIGELLSAAIDEKMEEWIRNALTQE